MIKDTVQFEKINSKYNRLWSQITNISLFFIATLLAYFGVWFNERIKLVGGDYLIKFQEIILFNQLAFIYVSLLVIIAIGVAFLLTHLFITRQKIKKLFQKMKIPYD